MLFDERYVGHELQTHGVEEYELTTGRGKGMKFLGVRNGLGLEFTVSADRCADIARFTFKGDNYGFLSANGYVAPSYYDDIGTGWLKSFSAGFLTTCGLTVVGNPTSDEGIALPLHGSISNTPADRINWTVGGDKIVIDAVMRECAVFSHKLIMERRIICSREKNSVTIEDKITNTGDLKTPLMILYHTNIGYPLLSELAVLTIPSSQVIPRTARAAADLERWAEILPPQPRFEEQCYYHEFKGEGLASIYNPRIGKGLRITFDPRELGYFVQWKMTGVKDYALGLEPGNCHVDGRDKMRAEGKLKFLEPGESKTYSVTYEAYEA